MSYYNSESICSFIISTRGTLNFVFDHKKSVEVPLSLADMISLSRSLREMSTQIIINNPFEKDDPESDQILEDLKRLYNDDCPMEFDGMDDPDSVKNLYEFIFEDKEYEFKKENESSYEETEGESEEESDEESEGESEEESEDESEEESEEESEGESEESNDKKESSSEGSNDEKESSSEESNDKEESRSEESNDKEGSNSEESTEEDSKEESSSGSEKSKEGKKEEKYCVISGTWNLDEDIEIMTINHHKVILVDGSLDEVYTKMFQQNRLFFGGNVDQLLDDYSHNLLNLSHFLPDYEKKLEEFFPDDLKKFRQLDLSQYDFTEFLSYIIDGYLPEHEDQGHQQFAQYLEKTIKFYVNNQDRLLSDLGLNAAKEFHYRIFHAFYDDYPGILRSNYYEKIENVSQ